jgi:hypothetical protein
MGERSESLAPERLITLQPHHRFTHGVGRKRAVDDAAFLLPLDEARVLEYAQVLEEARQRHTVGPRELGHRLLSVRKRSEYASSRRVRERRENGVQPLLTILNH